MGEYGSATHIYDQACIGSLLYLMAQKRKLDEDIEMIEALLAEYKI